MATTAKGTPYVESSDLVANYPAVSLALAEHIDDFGGKVLQVVRATDTTLRSTTSTSLVDVTGMSVTITPQRNTSAIIVIATVYGQSLNQLMQTALTDSSNNALSGGQSTASGTGSASIDSYISIVRIGYATPASTSAQTYKLRFAAGSGQTARVINDVATGQIFAIEVSA
jgi:hypothetical protein